ncbi:uncharacterized protein LOC144599077 [Rhinoraja longicauda]
MSKTRGKKFAARPRSSSVEERSLEGGQEAAAITTEPSPAPLVQPEQRAVGTCSQNRAVVSDDSDEDATPLESGTGSRLSRMERLMEQMLQRDLLREQQQTRQGSPGTPAVPFTALAIASPSFEGSIGDQVWAGQQEGLLAEDVRSTQSVQDQEELLGVVNRYVVIPRGGRPLEPKLAASIDHLSSKPLQERVVNEALELYTAPENCTSLNVPAVNSQIWGHLGQNIRNLELKLQKILKLLTAGMTSYARSIDGVDISTNQQDTLALLCTTQYQINNLRKEIIKPALNPKFAGLCKTPGSEPPILLFGKDLPKKVKDLEEESKTFGLVRAGLGPSRPNKPRRQYPTASTSRRPPYGTGESSGSATIPRKPFLGPRPERTPWKMRHPQQHQRQHLHQQQPSTAQQTPHRPAKRQK